MAHPTSRPPDQASAARSQFLSFYLGDEVYGIDILRVQEIRGWEPVRALPDVPAHIKGVLDLRGKIVPVVDLRVRFDLNDPAYSPTTVVIILHVRDDDGKHHVVGAVVDAVSDVLDVTGHDIKPAPRLSCCIGANYLSGMVCLTDNMVILLNIDRLFNQDDIAHVEAEVGTLGVSQ